MGRAQHRLAASGAARAAGDGHLRQGRRAPPHRRPRRPPGRQDHQLQGADGRGAQAPLPVADPQRRARARLRRRLRPLALRGRPHRPRARPGRAGHDREPLRPDQRLRGRAGRRGRGDHQVHAPRLGRGAARPAAGPARQRGQVLEVQPRRHRRARALGRVPDGRTRSRWSGPTPRSRRGTSYRPTRSGTATSSSASSCSRRCAGWRCAGRRRTSTSRSSGAGCSTRCRRRDRDRGGHPLRHPAARGRQPARAGRGRRPRHLRLQVPRRRSGRAGAGRGGDRERARHPVGPAHAPAGGARPRSADRPLRGRRGGAGPPQRQPGAQPRDRLPAGRFRLRGGGGHVGRHCGARPLARRLHRERRPHLAQPQPPALARRPLGDRPRRVALLPPRLVRRSGRPRPVRRPALGRP